MPDTKSPDTRPTIPLTTVITLCIAIASMSWAGSSEIHNYRLRAITAQLERNDEEIKQGQISDATIKTLVNGMADDIYEIKAGVQKVLDMRANNP